jgi:hypothetical protein
MDRQRISVGALAGTLALGVGLLAGCGAGQHSAETTTNAASRAAKKAAAAAEGAKIATSTQVYLAPGKVELHAGQTHAFAPNDFKHGGVSVVCTSNGVRLNVAVFRGTPGRTISGDGPVIRITRHGTLKVSCMQGGKNVAH